MTESDYAELAHTFLEDCRSAISTFAASLENAEVYALVIQFDPEYGDPVLALNTETGFHLIRKRYPDETPVTLRRLGGVRWDPAEFSHFNIALTSSATEQLTKRYSSCIESCSEKDGRFHSNLLVQTFVRVIDELSGLQIILDRTKDFANYLWPREASETELIDITRRTVPPPLFDKLFPEVRATEEFMAEIAQRSITEQASFWAGVFCDLVLEVRSSSAQRLQSLGRTEYDVSDALVNVGPPALPELVHIVEKHGLAEEWNEQDSEEWKTRGASTRRGWLASSALLAIHRFSGGSDEIIWSLQALLQSLHERDRNRPLAGVNGQLTAGALHALRPWAFPAAQFSESTNHLLNFHEFGVK